MNQLELFVIGSPRPVRVGEGPYFSIRTTRWGGSPTNPSVAAYDLDDNMHDVTDTVLSGSGATINVSDPDRIDLPKFSSNRKGRFRLIVTFTNDAYAPARPALDLSVID